MSKYNRGDTVLIHTLKHSEIVGFDTYNTEIDYAVLGVIKFQATEELSGMLIELAPDIDWWAFTSEIEVLN